MNVKLFFAVTALGTSMIAGSAMAQGDAEAGAQIFKRCAACHMVGPNAKKRIGPVLNDLFGRQAGSMEDFKYSPVMKALGEAGLTWTPEVFSGYVGNPRKWLPAKAAEMGLDCGDLSNCRNSMAFAGLKKQKQLDDVIAYLLTFDKDGLPNAAN